MESSFMYLLFVLSNIVPLVFYAIPYLFVKNIKWLILYSLFWLGIISFVIVSVFDTFTSTSQSEDMTIAETIAISLQLTLSCLFSAILGVIGRSISLCFRKWGILTNSQFFHATIFLLLMSITPTF